MLGVGMVALARFVDDGPWWGGAGFADDVSHILVGRTAAVVPVRCWEDLRCVFLTALTLGRLLALGVNPLQGSAALDSWMGTVHGICP